MTIEIAEGKCRVCVKQDATSVRYACNDCVNRLTELLRDIEEYAVDVLPDMTEKPRGTTGRMSPGYSSTSPANDDVIVALDPRSLPGDVDEHGDAIMRRPGDMASWVRSIPRSLDSLADSIAEQRDESRPGGTIAYDASYIRRNLWWIADRPWVDDVAADLIELHGMAQGLAHDKPGKPIAPCLNVTCNGQVFWGGVGRPAQCRDCSRTYDGLDLVRLEAASETAA